jgi:uncharacterized membrane protein HdeD (DUF308 family)
MNETLRHNWWIVLLRGILAIVFGVLAVIWPGPTLFTLVILFGAYALVDGGFGIGAALFSGAAARGTGCGSCWKACWGSSPASALLCGRRSPRWRCFT